MSEKLSGINKNTIYDALHSFRNEFVKSENSKVLNPDRGFYILKKYYQTQAPDTETAKKVKEHDFYKPFAEYLKGELQECTKTIILGNNQFGE